MAVGTPECNPSAGRRRRLLLRAWDAAAPFRPGASDRSAPGRRGRRRDAPRSGGRGRPSWRGAAPAWPPPSAGTRDRGALREPRPAVVRAPDGRGRGALAAALPPRARPGRRRARAAGAPGRGGAVVVDRAPAREVDAVREPAARAARSRQHDLEMLDDLRDRAIEEQRHPDDEPDDVLGGKLPAPQRRLVRGRQGLVDPLGIDRLLEPLEPRRPRSCADGENGLPRLHRPHLLWGRPIDRHCS